MNRIYDLAIINGAGGNTLHAWSRGYFEKMDELAISPKEPEYIEHGVYRMRRDDYEANKALFDKYLDRVDKKASTGRYEAQKRYDAVNTKRYNFKFNKKTDADIIEYLDNAPNMHGAIKTAIREQIKKGTSK